MNMSIHVRICRNCQRSIPAGLQECRHCPRKIHCKGCGTPLKPAMLHCRECGQRNAGLFPGDSITTSTAEKAVVGKSAAGTGELQIESRTRVVAPSGQSPSTSGRTSDVSLSSVREHVVHVLMTLICLKSLTVFFAAVAGVSLAIGVMLQCLQANHESEFDPQLERAAAVWVVDHFGVVQVKTESGEYGRFVAAEHLPAEPFTITEINLYGQEFDESELSFLPGLRSLQKLDVSRTSISARAMKSIGQVPKLKSLQARATRLSASDFRLLQNGQRIENCSVSGSKSFDDEVLITVSEVMPNLKVFACTATGVSENGLQTLTTLRSLQKLTAQKHTWSEKAILEFQKALPECQLSI